MRFCIKDLCDLAMRSHTSSHVKKVITQISFSKNKKWNRYTNKILITHFIVFLILFFDWFKLWLFFRWETIRAESSAPWWHGGAASWYYVVSLNINFDYLLIKVIKNELNFMFNVGISRLKFIRQYFVCACPLTVRMLLNWPNA